MQLCFATNNANKLKEISAMLGADFKLISLQDIDVTEDIPETSDTIEANARQKAMYVFEHYAVPCFADDTGLEVKALGGAPGVYSARYAGEQKDPEANTRLLLKNLENKSDRSARFKSVICLADESGTYLFEGIINGKIINEKRGAGGFGYDPVFVPDGYEQTFAEMSAELKNQISHRAIAFQKLISFLRQLKK
jgi:XTP/dITP diphosphohydrolase